MLPEWIDFNGHLRDAYYVVVLSLATDSLMDRLGLDAEYRARTRCTLYTLEMHMHWLHEVKGTETLEVDAHLLASDAKRLHVGFDVRVIGRPEVVATAEFMLLHVRQGETPAAAPFPPAVEQNIAAFKAASGAAAWAGPASRALALGKR
ncbi:MAG TPA: thioesterase family protein [Steroidobacteraceae bacterium]|nr:thioesterase family protein [Steroidobacteraceae bacterium]